MSTPDRAPIRKLSHDGSKHVTDEKFNTASHLVGVVFALMGLVYLVVSSAMHASPWHVVSFAIYGATLVVLFLASTLHHGVHSMPRLEAALMVTDYQAIYLLIAGSFTPICLVLVRGALGWSVFGVSWTVALVGIILKAAMPHVPKYITSTLYLAMGWLALVLLKPIYVETGWGGLAAMGAGGIFYSVGATFFAIEKPNPFPGVFGFHEIWHIMVLLGAGAQFFFMLQWVLPHA